MNTPTPLTDTEITLTGAYTCTHHNDAMRAACPVCLVTTLTAERDQLRARAERAEDNLAALEQCHDDNCRGVVKIAAELATAKERLRSEAMDDYAAIKDLQRELAAERGKLDWVFQNCKVEANDYSTGNRDVYYVHDREDLGVAMKEDAK